MNETERNLSHEARGVHIVESGDTASADAVLDALQAVIDPELGLDVVSLGLVYELHLSDGVATVMMTLTTPGCPLHGSIRADVERHVTAVAGVRVVDVQLVWDPPWTPRRILEEGRRRLGWPGDGS